MTAGDVWGDGSGYQMLLDADATAFGTIIPETGGLTASGDASPETYAEFEYKIPENADGAMTTQNIVLNNSITILIPAGTYDYCITNPTPGDRIWIASDNVDPGRADNYEFVEGCTYEFSLALSGSNDGVTITITEPGAPLTVPENLTVNPAATSAAVAWDDTDDSKWNLRWRPWVDTEAGDYYLCDLDLDNYQTEMGDWAIEDADGDGYCWGVTYSSSAQDNIAFYSESWQSGVGALTPDNWLFSKDFTFNEGDQLQFDLWCVADQYPENMMVYLFQINESDTTVYSLSEEDLVATGTPTTYTLDLSELAGKTGFFAFRHYNTEDQYRLFLDNIFVGNPDNVVEEAEWNYVNDLAATNYTIEGLTPETKYEVQVQAAGDVSTSDWCDIVTFVTLAEQAGKLGDVNKDGFVNISDVTALIDALLGGYVMDDNDNYSPDNANVNEDDTVDISDVTALIDLLLSGNAD